MSLCEKERWRSDRRDVPISGVKAIEIPGDRFNEIAELVEEAILGLLAVSMTNFKMTKTLKS